MKTLKQIFVAYEIGDISSENLPDEIYKIIETTNMNNHLLTITNKFEPSKADILKLLFPAFGISEKDRLTKTEKLSLLLNKWLNNKLENAELLDRIQLFELEGCLNSDSLERFLEKLSMTINGDWVPSDCWDGTIEDIESDLMKNDNRYSDFLIKKSS